MGRFRRMGGYQSGQMGQTVTLLSQDFEGSNPSPPTHYNSESSSVGRAIAFQAIGREFEPRLSLFVQRAVGRMVTVVMPDRYGIVKRIKKPT
jgi:hypothetical protein